MAILRPEKVNDDDVAAASAAPAAATATPTKTALTIPTSSNLLHSCQVCHAPSCTMRCSLCQSVYYCSVTCQRLDWTTKGGHATHCTGRRRNRNKKKNKKKSTSTTTATASKTQPIVGPLPQQLRHDEDAQQAVQQLWSSLAAADAAAAASFENKEETQDRGNNMLGQQHVTKRTSSSMAESTTSIPKTAAPAAPASVEHHPYRILKDTTTTAVRMDSTMVSYLVEDMPQISRFQVTLKRRTRRRRQQQATTSSRSTPSSSLIITMERKQQVSADGDIPYSNCTLVVIGCGSSSSSSSNSSGPILFCGEFPHRIQEERVQWQHEEEEQEGDDDDDVDVYQISLPYPNDLSSSSLLLQMSSPLSLNVQQVNSATCATCDHPLFPPPAPPRPQTTTKNDDDDDDVVVPSTTAVIQKILPLPQGYWDDVAEYLMCYSGEAMVDFSSSAAVPQRGVALEDVNMMCFHPSNVASSVSLAALPEEEEEHVEKTLDTTTVVDNDDDDDAAKLWSAEGRGDRPWTDTTGGGLGSVTLCCNHCFTALGFVSGLSPDSWRLWKHRLNSTSTFTAENDGKTTKSPAIMQQPMRSCASFLVGEMVRYAESKAIFTFVVGIEGEARDRCLLLQLLSWETSMASSSFDSNDSHQQRRTCDFGLDFCRVAKIIFEESAYPPPLEEGSDRQWLWGGKDLCCPPESKSLPQDFFMPSAAVKSTIHPWQNMPSSGASTVRFDLPRHEYDQVWADLVSSRKWFSSSYEQATISMKMGESRPSLALAAVKM